MEIIQVKDFTYPIEKYSESMSENIYEDRFKIGCLSKVVWSTKNLTEVVAIDLKKTNFKLLQILNSIP